MSQEAAIMDLLTEARMNSSTNSKPTPYRSGHPVDSIPNEDLPLHEKQRLQKQLQKYTGSFNWLATQTRPDISTITNILAQHNSNPSHGHIDAARYILQYLKGTSNLGISFSTLPNSNLESFLKYPVDPSQLLPFSDANWGPQDQSVPKPVQHITNILKDLNLLDQFTDGPIPIMNDNAAAVQWSYNMTSKGLRYIQIRENAVREQIALGLIQQPEQHQSGATNIADFATKEDKDDFHFLSIVEAILSPIPGTAYPSHFPSSRSTIAHATLRAEGGVRDIVDPSFPTASDMDSPHVITSPSS